MGDMPYMLAMMLSMLCPLILGAAVKMLDGDMWTRGLVVAELRLVMAKKMSTTGSNSSSSNSGAN